VASEVWFDQSELRGGDGLGCEDPRTDPRLCALCSSDLGAHTKTEPRATSGSSGKLAVDRSHLMASYQGGTTSSVLKTTGKFAQGRSFAAVESTRWVPTEDSVFVREVLRNAETARFS